MTLQSSAPPVPPRIDGYEFLEVLGSGGFADVYLYEQALPRRRVAVKVLFADDATPASLALFRDEANLMAQLSSHPAIVTVYQAGVLPDGRPFLVMEHCPKPNLGQRYRTETFPVQDAVSIGIQIAGAVETAHRAGVLHRDIKPANVLVTEYNRPALTDFGIAATISSAASGDARGLSVPWSPPESLDGTWSGPPTDVYGLAATLYSLLAGRSPYELPGQPNDVAALAARIRQGALPPIGRADVPPPLEAVLATGMARSPQARYTSALSFARALQTVQQDAGFPVTTVDVLDSGFGHTGGGATTDERTAMRPLFPAAGAGPVGPSQPGTVPLGVSQPGTASLPTVPLVASGSVPAAAYGSTGTASVYPTGSVYPTYPTGGTYSTGGTPGFATAGGFPADSLGTDRTVLRAPAPAPDFGPPLPQKRPVWPGIVLDAALVLAVAGAAAYLLLG